MGQCETCHRREAHYRQEVDGRERCICNVCSLLYQYGEDAEQIFRMVQRHEKQTREMESL